MVCAGFQDIQADGSLISTCKSSLFYLMGCADGRSGKLYVCDIASVHDLTDAADNLNAVSGDGIEVVRGIRQIMNARNITNVELSAASIRTAHQVEQAALAGADQAAVSLDILKACANHPLTDNSVKQFVKDWESLYGEGKRVYNL